MGEADVAGRGWSGTVTLNDVARAAGVHVSTVSRALDPQKHSRVKAETRQRIIQVANELGYRPDLVARSLQSGRTGTVGVILADLGNTFVTPLVHGIAASLESAQALPTIAETQDDHARMLNIIDHMLSKRVDGIVAVAARAADQHALEAASKVVPVVLASRPLENTELALVTHDDWEAGRLAAEHIHQLGHRTVAQLCGPYDVLNFSRRSEGFRRIALDRSDLVAVQTPQGFVTAVLRGAHGADDHDASDDAVLVERFGGSVATVAGDPANIKVTFPDDLRLAEALLP